MPCGCTEKVADFSPMNAPADTQRLPGAGHWHIVVASNGARDTRLWQQLAALCEAREDVLWTCVDTSPELVLRSLVEPLEGCRYMALPGPFNWAEAVNAATSRAPGYTCYLHDDVTLPDPASPGAWLDALQAALDTDGIGMAVPLILGDCKNAAQAVGNLNDPASMTALALLPPSSAPPYFHCPEFVSGACVAMKTSTHFSFPFDAAFTGYEWHQIDVQMRLARAGQGTVVACGFAVSHTKGTAHDPETLAQGYRANMERFCNAHGIRVEFKSRPSLPRAYVPADYGLDAYDLTSNVSLCAVVDSASGVRAALALRGYEMELCLVDASGRRDVWEAVAKADLTIQPLARPQVMRWRYQPQYEADPLRQAVSLSSQPNVVLVDARDGHALPLEKMKGSRLRCGAHYDLPQRIGEFHLGMMQHYAIGDTLMMTPGLHAIKAQWPHMKLVVHHGWAAGELLVSNPDVASVQVYDMSRIVPPDYVTDIGTKNGSEGTIRAPFEQMGLQAIDRRLRFYPKAEEWAAAMDWLRKWKREDAPEGFEDKPLTLVGVQMHGGWGAKNWAHTNELVQKLLDAGHWCVMFGVDEKRKTDAVEHPRVLRGNGASIREIVTLTGLLDAIVTFDSGLGYGALAMGTPVVSLWGPHDPMGLMGDAGEGDKPPPNLAMLRARTPEGCQAKYGKNCRTLHGGSQCPLREGFGADCLDDIPAQVVLDAVQEMPLWGVPMRERVKG